MPVFDNIWTAITQRKAYVPAQAEIPLERVIGSITAPQYIQRDKHYFAVVINELFLQTARQWLKEYDPVVLAISQFVYGNNEVSLPFLVGPKLLGPHAEQAPEGMIYRNTRVAGIHPFRGGRIISTVVLCRQKRHDYGRRLLSLVETVAGAIPFGKEMTNYVKLTDSLLDGMDALMGVGDMDPLVGLRQEFDNDLGPPIRRAYYALVDASESQMTVNRLWVRNGSLFIGDDSSSLTPFRQASYVLYSVRGSETVSELDTLPFAATKRKIIELSASTNEEDWKQAKAELVVLYRQLLTSPDLTGDQARSYHHEILKQAQENRDHVKKVGDLHIRQPEEARSNEASEVNEIERELRTASSLLDLE